MSWKTDGQDITRRLHQGSLFSEAAHRSIAGDKQRLRQVVLRYIHSTGFDGATSDEIEQALELPHQTVSARISEAKAKGLIKWNGDRRPTRSGRKAAVMVVA